MALARSDDKRVELVGQVDIGLGRTFTSSSMTPAASGVTEERGGFHLAYTVAPAIRYWVPPQFAIAGLAGLRGDYDTQSVKKTLSAGMASITTETSTSTLANSIVAQLQLLGVF